MPRPANSAPRPPEDFAGALATTEPVLLVGGQAVNLWALHFSDRTSDLAPFTSRDADIIGDSAVLAELGKLAGVKPQIFPLRPPTNEVGVVIAQDSAGVSMLVEVLRHVRGVTHAELTDPVYTMAVGPNQVRVRVPGPIALLQSKLANIRGIDQRGRQDGRHVVILARILPAYLADLATAAAEGRLNERKLIDFLEGLLELVVYTRNRKILGSLGVNPGTLFTGLNPAKLPKLRAFLNLRLPRSLNPGEKPARPRK